MIHGIYPFYLRTTTTTEGTGYPTLEGAREALRRLLTMAQSRGHHTVEQPDGRWVSHQQPSGSVTIWIEDEAGHTVRLE